MRSEAPTKPLSTCDLHPQPENRWGEIPHKDGTKGGPPEVEGI